MLREFYTGSYALENEEGIVRFVIDTETGKINKKSGYSGIYHPSYLCIHENKKVMYSVQEQVPVGAVHAMYIKDDDLEHVCVRTSDGADPCHLSVDQTVGMLWAANYTSGSLVGYRLDPEGIPGPVSVFDQHDGKGINPVRQECAHVHFAKEQEGKLFVADLGMDQVFVYELDEQNGIKDSGVRLQVPAGAGPRHLEFHPEFKEIVYVLCELTGKVAVFRKNTETEYSMIQFLDTLPADYSGENISAAIKLSGNLLFASNRGHDSITVFEVLKDGRLKRIQSFSTGGKTPRDFAVFGEWLVAANQDSDLLTVLKIDRKTGTLTLTSEAAKVIRPCCIAEL